MPKFTQQELEEIQRNTERIEQERKRRYQEASEGRESALADSELAAAKKNSKKPKAKSGKKTAGKKGSRSKGDFSVMERMIAVILLILTIAISYAVMILS
jgi:hypothetical protein